MTLTVHLTAELERRLREQASRDGSGVEEYVVRLIERAAGVGEGPSTALLDDDFEGLLDSLALGPESPLLPAGFSRSDIYIGHD